MDVVTAFLNKKLSEDIYVQQSEGYVQTRFGYLVCNLKKFLYGLKQASRCWNKSFYEYMKSIGFEQSTADPCVYIRVGTTVAIAAVYVDDLILITKTLQEMNELKASLSMRFRIKDMGKLYYCLGISIVHDEDQKCFWLHQKQCILCMLKIYQMSNAKIVSTPADFDVKLQRDDGVSKSVDFVKYQSLVET